MSTFLSMPKLMSNTPPGWAVAAGLLVLSCQGATAAEGAAPVPLIRGFSVSGQNPLPSDEVSLALAPFLRKEASLVELQAATAALENLFAQRGLGLYRVVLPLQELGDTIALQVVRFAVGQVTVDGAQRLPPEHVRRSLPELKEGGTPNLDRLAVQTAIANENPSRQVQVALTAGAEPDTVDATVRVKETRPLEFGLSASNTGAVGSGRDRVTGSLAHHNFLNLDHQWLAAYTTSVTHPGAVHQWGLSHRVPLYNQLSTLEWAYTRSSVVGNFGTFTSSGAGHTLGLTVQRHFQPVNGVKRAVSLAWEDKVFNPTELNGVALAGQTARRTRPLSLGYTARGQSERSYWDAQTSLAVNMPGGRGNNLASYQTESTAIASARWRAWRARGNWVGALGDDWLLAWRGQAQWAPTALLSAEQMGLGGVASLRGTQERALSGDTGVLSAFEISTPEWSPGVRAVGFVDAGWLHGHPTAATAPVNDSAASIGLGLRYGQGPVSLTLDYGWVAKASKVPRTLNGNAPQTGDQKLHMGVSARF